MFEILIAASVVAGAFVAWKTERSLRTNAGNAIAFTAFALSCAFFILVISPGKENAETMALLLGWCAMFFTGTIQIVAAVLYWVDYNEREEQKKPKTKFGENLETKLKQGTIRVSRTGDQEYVSEDYEYEVREPQQETKPEPVEEELDKLNLPEPLRTSHMLLCAGSGQGKTQTIQYMLSRDLWRDNVTVVVIDSQRDLIETIKKLRIPKERYVCIEPDIEYPLAVNLFDIGQERLNHMNPSDREMFRNGLVELYDYIFGALSADLSSKQDTLFRYIVRLMMEIPDATINTMVEVLQKGGIKKYAWFINKLSQPGQLFFRTEFDGGGFEDTKQQVLRRLLGLLENEMFHRMFSHTKSKLNLAEELNLGGKIILINTDKARLKSDGSRFFGRFMIAMIYQAVMERAVIPGNERTKTYVYVDEFQDYFDNRITDMLEQARKYNCGMILATQELAKFPAESRNSLIANTAIKLAGGTTHQDASLLSKNMRCIPEQITNVPTLQFMLAARGQQTTHVSIPAGILEAKGKRNDLSALRDMTRNKYCTRYEAERKQPEPEVTMKKAAEPEPPPYSPSKKKGK